MCVRKLHDGKKSSPESDVLTLDKINNSGAVKSLNSLNTASAQSAATAISNEDHQKQTPTTPSKLLPISKLIQTDPEGSNGTGPRIKIPTLSTRAKSNVLTFPHFPH
ncbi:hypothetical protein WR25_24710 [Diploscapter pachys]|uniref:Uncharacterized protein n=1 Tax=Diploscapter pachys TaxID=2018661 RepID=A0A2A2L918_9BILA|nr:hypothetical protein WR25_24710 [Diploscapter pachys]